MASQTSLYREVLQDRQDLFNYALANGVYTPFIYPWDTLPIVFLACGVLFGPQIPGVLGRIFRISMFLLELSYCLLRWPYARTVGFTAGYGLGLAAFWGLIMTFILLILHDPGKDFQRIEINELDRPEDSSETSNTGSAGAPNGSLDTVRRRKVDLDQGRSTGSVEHESTGLTKFVWQGYPQNFLHRLDWSIDLMTTFRGINWNFRIPIKYYQVPPPEGDPPVLSEKALTLNKGALTELRRTAIRNFIYYYFILDALKTFMVTDPYWLGIAPLESPSPWVWLSNLNGYVPGATRFVRLSVSLAAVVSALTLIFSLSPVFFTVVLPYLVGDKLYMVTKSPLLEVWMYPPQWGSMFEVLCSKGLAGMWSTWWHQMFRYGISEPSRLLIQRFDIGSRSQLGRIVQLLIAFGLTASIHAAASSTTFSVIPSRPSQPFIFFMSQAAGILVQTEVSKRLNMLMNFPRAVRRFGNFGFAFIFLWFIGPYLADDFARCQIWLFEPVPISFLRGLGFGPGDCWVPWLSFSKGGRWLGWWDGGAWYRSGIGIF